MLQNNIPDPCFNYTTKLHLSQVFGRLQSGILLRSVGMGVLRLFVAMLQNVTNGIYKT
jgi:hypothetical protein